MIEQNEFLIWFKKNILGILKMVKNMFQYINRNSYLMTI